MTEQVEEQKIDNWTKLISQPSLKEATFIQKRKYWLFGPPTKITLYCLLDKRNGKEFFIMRSVRLTPSDTIEIITKFKDLLTKKMLENVLAWQNANGY